MIRYKAKSIFVDKETGEIITRKNAETNYQITKTTKSYDFTETWEKDGYKFGEAIVIYTRECEIKRQLNLFNSKHSKHAFHNGT